MKKQHIQFFARYGVILLFAVTMLVPFFWMIITSITINLDRKAGQRVRLSLHLVPKLQ